MKTLLGRSWNGYLLDSAESVLKRAGNFSWKGIRTPARKFQASYPKGITLRGKAKQAMEGWLERSGSVPWWDITIRLKMVLHEGINSYSTKVVIFRSP